MRALLLALLLAACTRENPEAPAAPVTSDGVVLAEPGRAPPSPLPPSPLPPPSPAQARAAGDLAPCPGYNPDIRRPEGSNCLGIVPAECGADKVNDFVGRGYEPATTLSQLELAVGHRNIRITRFDQAVTDDLQRGRLNVVYDRAGRITHIDCY
jgi:Peptidase inhibitor I78 family